MNVVKLNKSSRHSKITGDFAERLVLYWLSKYGFECTYVDHTGIDIIARNPHTKELMGISVKSRSRNIGKEEEYVSLPKENFEKVEIACKTFGCVSYFAIVIDAGYEINMFILPTRRLLEYFPMGKRGTVGIGGRVFTVDTSGYLSRVKTRPHNQIYVGTGRNIKTKADRQ